MAIYTHIFEHVALNVSDASTMAEWYAKHLKLEIVRTAPNQTHFLSDQTGRVVLEIYSNPEAKFPDYTKMHPLELHLAFNVLDIKNEKGILVEAGCSIEQDIWTTPAGDEMIMLRDPWGIALQLIVRKEPMIFFQ